MLVISASGAMMAALTRLTDAVARCPMELKVYPPFPPTGPVREGAAPGHAVFGPQGVSVWKGDVLALLEKHLLE